MLTDSFNNDFHEIFEKYPGNAMDNWLKFVLKMPNCDKLSKRKKSQVNSRVKQVGKAIDDFAKDFPHIYDKYPNDTMHNLMFIVYKKCGLISINFDVKKC